MTKEKIENFINFRFTPLTKNKYVTRILFFWALNIPFYFYDSFSLITGIVFSVINVLSTVLFIMLAITIADTKFAKFLSDGISCIYYSAVFLFAGFILLSIANGYNYLLLAILILLYLLFAALFLLIVLRNIKKDAYNEKNLGGSGSVFMAPFAGGLLGISVGRLFFSGTSNQVSFYILGACLLFMAYILILGSMSLVKWYFLRNLSKYQN